MDCDRPGSVNQINPLLPQVAFGHSVSPQQQKANQNNSRTLPFLLTFWSKSKKNWCPCPEGGLCCPGHPLTVMPISRASAQRWKNCHHLKKWFFLSWKKPPVLWAQIKCLWPLASCLLLLSWEGGSDTSVTGHFLCLPLSVRCPATDVERLKQSQGQTQICFPQNFCPGMIWYAGFSTEQAWKRLINQWRQICL